MFQDISSKKKFFEIFLTDRKISSPINYMIWWGIFSISQKIFEKNFFAWNVLKHKVKPKNSRKSTFFQKLKFPPYFWKTLVKFSSPKVCCNFSKSQGGKIQTLLELSSHSHLKKEGMTAAIADHRRRGGRSKPY